MADMKETHMLRERISTSARRLSKERAASRPPERRGSCGYCVYGVDTICPAEVSRVSHVSGSSRYTASIPVAGRSMARALIPEILHCSELHDHRIMGTKRRRAMGLRY